MQEKIDFSGPVKTAEEIAQEINESFDWEAANRELSLLWQGLQQPGKKKRGKKCRKK